MVEALRLRRGRKDRAEDHIVSVTGRCALLDRVHGPSHEPRRRPDRSHARDGRSVRSHMYSGGARGERDIGAVVDQHARRGRCPRDDVPDERAQRAASRSRSRI
jgi:hypothetical protein